MTYKGAPGEVKRSRHDMRRMFIRVRRIWVKTKHGKDDISKKSKSKVCLKLWCEGKNNLIWNNWNWSQDKLYDKLWAKEKKDKPWTRVDKNAATLFKWMNITEQGTKIASIWQDFFLVAIWERWEQRDSHTLPLEKQDVKK